MLGGKSTKKPEILAPAGSVEAFYAAIEAGADAVYLGLKTFNARALAKNFTLEELKVCREITQEKGVRLLVTLNSLIKEDELGQIVKTLAALKDIGVDGIIIQDLATWYIARHYFPKLALHASTLMTIHNSLGVKMAHAMGFKRVVLAREMTLEEIAKAVKAAPIEVECFVHGAMCFTFSGLCLMSSLFGGRASTRGQCVQPCRRIYTKAKGKKGAFFSMLDLNAIGLAHRLGDIGVSSLKIEGRLRPAHYVYHVVKAFRTVLDSPPGDQMALAEANALLQNALGRHTSTGYFIPNGPSPVSPGSPPNTGRCAGVIVRAYRGLVLLRPHEPLHRGDRIRFVSQDGAIQKALKIKDMVEREDGLIEIKARLSESFFNGGLFYLTDRKEKAFPQRFKGIETSKFPGYSIESKAKRVISKLFKPSKGLETEETPLEKRRKGPLNTWVRLASPEDLSHFTGFKDISGFYLPVQGLKSFSRIPRPKVPVTWYLPPIILESQIPWYKEALLCLKKAGFTGFQCGNLGQIHLFQRFKGIKPSASYHVNILNSVSLKGAKELDLSAVEFSLESDLKNLIHALKRSIDIPVDLVFHAYPPVFTSRLSGHKWLRPGEALKSPKGEEFIWMVRDHIGYLVHATPFSARKKLPFIKRLPIRRLIIDVSFGPPAWTFKKKGGGKSILRAIQGKRRRLNLEEVLL